MLHWNKRAAGNIYFIAAFILVYFTCVDGFIRAQRHFAVDVFLLIASCAYIRSLHGFHYGDSKYPFVIEPNDDKRFGRIFSSNRVLSDWVFIRWSLHLTLKHGNFKQKHYKIFQMYSEMFNNDFPTDLSFESTSERIFDKKASIRWQDSAPPRASNGGRSLCVQISRNGARPCQYIDTTRKTTDCATTLPLTVLYSETL